MGKYDEYLKAFEESLTPLDGFLIAEKLGEYNMPYQIRNCIMEAAKGINYGYGNLLELIITEEISNFNQSHKNPDGGIRIEKMRDNSINIINFDKTFTIKTLNKSSYDLFMSQWPTIQDDNIKIAKLVKYNVSKYEPLIKTAFEELNKKYKATTGKDLLISATKANANGNIPIINICITGETLRYTTTINLMNDVEDWDVVEKELIDLFSNGFQYQKEKAKKEEIKKLVHDICWKYRIPKFELNYKKDQTSFYNIKEGWADLSIPLKNDTLMSQFEIEIRNTAIMIMELANFSARDWQVTGKISYELGSKMYFKFKKEEIIDGFTYTLYDSRVGAKKAILHVFRDGCQLSGNERKRAIKLLGYGKTAKTPWALYEFHHNSQMMSKTSRERVIRRLNKKYNTDIVY